MENNEPNFEGEEMKLPTKKTDLAAASDTHSETKGAFIVVLVVALIVILIGLVFWYRTANPVAIAPVSLPIRPAIETNKEPETTTATAQVDSLEVMSTSDEMVTIEADLESTDLNNLEAELTQIEAELAAEGE